MKKSLFLVLSISMIIKSIASDLYSDKVRKYDSESFKSNIGGSFPHFISFFAPWYDKFFYYHFTVFFPPQNIVFIIFVLLFFAYFILLSTKVCFILLYVYKLTIKLII